MYGTAFRAFAAFPNFPSFPHFSLITFPSLQLGLQAPAALFFERGLINSSVKSVRMMKSLRG
jgi:hypothetical protein